MGRLNELKEEFLPKLGIKGEGSCSGLLERLHGQQENRVELLKIHMNTEKEGEVQKENKLFEETIVLTKAIMA